ncbi:MAG: iron-sulfur cluster insertion protein ErpA [Gammaproteobacteria bacterium]|nr:iron-sulfur cluster insertion protein ErpA [Gammaproteobacteria bacterium]
MSSAEAVFFSDSAANKVKALLLEEDNDQLKLRVYITGGGCAGFSYGFKFDEELKEGDTVVENEGVQLLVDSLSIQYLMGATVDYTEGLQGSRFVIDNPGASSTCGCGSSFSI